jgi:hypothetical protein
MFRVLTALILTLTIYSFPGCGKKNENPQDKQVEKSEDKDDQKTGFKKLDDFVDNMKKMTNDLKEGKEVEVVDFRDLKALLPENIGDLKRTNSSGEKTNAFGINVSKAEGKYSDEPVEGEQPISIDVEITDLGNVKGWAGLAMWAWTFSDIDKESDEGYEKTFKSGNNKGLESYNNSSKSGKIEMFVAERFMVKVEGNNVSMEAIKGALDEIGISNLEQMKDKGVTYKEDAAK